MNDLNRVAVDLSKNLFQVCGLSANNKVLFNKKMNRSKFSEFMAQLPPCPVFMEACYSAHHWGRTLNNMGHQVHLIPAQHVKPFVRGNKNDHNDALAIAEAANRPNIRFVPVKSIEQQEVMAAHRIRSRLIHNRTQVVNQARGLLSDFGIVFPQGFKAFKKALVELQDNESLSPMFKSMMLQMLEEFNQLSERLEGIEQFLSAVVSRSELGRIVHSIPGIGLINASAIIASIGSGQAFHSPREFAVWLGLTPRQYASGSKSRHGGITKRGDRYLRTLLIHAGRAAKKWAQSREDTLSLWIKQLEARVGTHKATVAVAHKLARLVWILLQKRQCFVPQVAH